MEAFGNSTRQNDIRSLTGTCWAELMDKYSKSYEVGRLNAVRRLYREIDFKADWRVADIGSGEGFYADIISPEVAEVVCMDAAADKLGRCRDKGYSTLQLDLNQPLPPDDESFDFVNALEIIEHLDDPSHFLKEVHRILKPGGRLVLSTINKTSPEGLKGRLLAGLGGSEWNAWDPTHKHIFSYAQARRYVSELFEITDSIGYYYGVHSRRIPSIPVFGRCGFSSRLLARFGFCTLFLCRRK